MADLKNCVGNEHIGADGFEAGSARKTAVARQSAGASGSSST